jgi:adenine-specific DNA-methyltransferase
MDNNVKNYGQVFTEDDTVKIMISLIKNKGLILEPSAGNGAFSKKLNCISIELDEKFKHIHTYNMDFFQYNIDNKFDTIIGNPPFVKYNDILIETKKLLNYSIFDKRSNLYLFFIYKCILHLNENGELIFITPREFINSTSSINLNNFIYNNGTITHFYDYGDKMLFPNFSPNVAIWRFEKNNFNRITKTLDGNKIFKNINGQLIFNNNSSKLSFNDLFFVKVGAVSGNDKIFENENGNMDFVCSYTRMNNKLKKMFYNIKDEHLNQYKDILINRKIKNFNENNWWMYGRDFYKSDKPRIYVNSKTRIKNPFFIHECLNYDGSVLAIFPKKDNIDIHKACIELNNINWKELGFKIGDRFVFNQRSLSNILLPENFYSKIVK